MDLVVILYVSDFYSWRNLLIHISQYEIFSRWHFLTVVFEWHIQPIHFQFPITCRAIFFYFLFCQNNSNFCQLFSAGNQKERNRWKDLFDCQRTSLISSMSHVLFRLHIIYSLLSTVLLLFCWINNLLSILFFFSYLSLHAVYFQRHWMALDSEETTQSLICVINGQLIWQVVVMLTRCVHSCFKLDADSAARPGQHCSAIGCDSS